METAESARVNHLGQGKKDNFCPNSIAKGEKSEKAEIKMGIRSRSRFHFFRLIVSDHDLLGFTKSLFATFTLTLFKQGRLVPLHLKPGKTGEKTSRKNRALFLHF